MIPLGLRICESRRRKKGVEVRLGPGDRKRLEAVIASRNSAQKHVWRARIVLLSADGVGTMEIQRQTGKAKPTIWRWQERFMTAGVDGLLHDKTRPSRKPPLAPNVVTRVVEMTLAAPPGETTQWTGRAMAKAAGISHRSVQRIWAAHGLMPRRIGSIPSSCRRIRSSSTRSSTSSASTSIHPSTRALVLSIDEKSQIQALDRTQPGLPMKKGRAGTMTHDYKRHVQASRHDDAVRGAQRARGQGDRPVHGAAPASGVHPLSQSDQPRDSSRTRAAFDC
jgi:transposase